MALSQKIQKRVKDITAWIGAYSRLIELEGKYFGLSINEFDKKKTKEYRQVSDRYGEGISNLIKKHHEN